MTVRYDRQTFLCTVTGAMEPGSLSGYVGTFGTESEEPVRSGAMLPVSGSLGQVEVHGKHITEQTVEDINGVDDVLGQPVGLATVDTEGSASVATDGYASLADVGVVGFAGGLVSDVSLALTPKTAGDAVVEVSPAGTNPRLSDAGRADGRKFFDRTVPSDSLQATAMAKIFDAPQYADADRIALLTVNEAFGSDLGTALGDQLDAEVITEVSYDPSAKASGGVIDEVFADSPDAVGFISVPGQERGVLDVYGASDHEALWVFSTGLFGGEIPPYYEGFYSASLSPVRTDGYFHLTQRLSDIVPLRPYAANAHDALFLMATTAECAGGASGPAITDTLQIVLDGAGYAVSVGELDRIRTLADADRELNHQGASNGVDLTGALEPLSSYLVEHIRNGSVEQIEPLQRQFFEFGGGR